LFGHTVTPSPVIGLEVLIALTEIPQLCSPEFLTCEVWST
jgi:hypothetical protein